MICHRSLFTTLGRVELTRKWLKLQLSSLNLLSWRLYEIGRREQDYKTFRLNYQRSTKSQQNILDWLFEPIWKRSPLSTGNFKLFVQTFIPGNVVVNSEHLFQVDQTKVKGLLCIGGGVQSSVDSSKPSILLSSLAPGSNPICAFIGRYYHLSFEFVTEL